MLLISLLSLTVLAAAQPRCDPETQFEKNGQCCKMCGPGTSMSTTSPCDEPQCRECREDEYQEGYTTQPKCKLQPFCDPNKNFQRASQDKRKRTVCTCEHGFHCSSADCLNCVPHSQCPPGEGVKSIGNHSKDTLCEKCPDGSFSSTDSWSDACQKWTKCGDGYHIKEEGTAMSDSVCEMNSPAQASLHLYWLLALIPFALVLVYFMYKAKYPDAEGGLKSWFKSCLGDNKEPLAEVNVVANPTDAEEESMLPDTKEGLSQSMPEENDDVQCQDRSLNVVGVTANGLQVQQEMGKTEHLSRQESQTDTWVTDYSCQECS